MRRVLFPIGRMTGGSTLTIERFCAEVGVSKSTLYRRIKETGIALDTLRGPDAELTPDALQILAALVADTRRRTVDKESTERAPESDPTHSNALLSELQEAREQLRIANAELAVARTKVEELLQDAAKREREYSDTLAAFLVKQQFMEEQRLIAEKNATQSRKSLFERIFKR